MLQNILDEFGFYENTYVINPFGTGLINNTWLVEKDSKKYILQRINELVFKTPSDIDENITRIAGYLNQHHSSYLFTMPVKTAYGNTLISKDHGSYRMFKFIEGSHTYTVLQKPVQAYEAAKQFAKFTKLLSGFNADSLKITLPDFHNLTLRYQQFEHAVVNGNQQRVRESNNLIETLRNYAGIVEVFEEIKYDASFKKRVTHHDTKISNVLFNDDDGGMCVIDLDTVMPGYFISDIGDMMRTYLCEASEEETDFSKINIRDEYFDAIVEGYLSQMKDELSAGEISAFVYAGKFMIYMQALRFLADYLDNDVYYGCKYPLHNFNRAANQIVLLEKLMEKQALFEQKVGDMATH